MMMMIFYDQMCRLCYVGWMNGSERHFLPLVPVVTREHPSMPKERREKINCCCCCYANGKATSFAFFLLLIDLIANKFYPIYLCIYNEHLRMHIATEQEKKRQVSL